MTAGLSGSMMIVDANVAVYWCVETPLSAEARTIALRSDLCAPSIILAEAANGLTKFARGGFIGRAQAVAGLDVIADTISNIINDESLLKRAIELSLDLSHPIYDCVYLALASARAETLATGDRRLAALAGAAGIEAVLIGPRK